MKLYIYNDDCAESPREWAQSTLICWHSRYNLGDGHSYADNEELFRELATAADEGFDDYVDHQEEEVFNDLLDKGVEFVEVQRIIGAAIAGRAFDIVHDNYTVLPVFMYDHSGIALNTGGFGCPWDSGQVGFIYYTKDQVRTVFDGREECAISALKQEIETYSDYVNGDVYGFTLEDDDGEHIDGCCGFYGSDNYTNGIAESLQDQGYDYDELVKDMEYAR